MLAFDTQASNGRMEEKQKKNLQLFIFTTKLMLFAYL